MQLDRQYCRPTTQRNTAIPVRYLPEHLRYSKPYGRWSCGLAATFNS